MLMELNNFLHGIRDRFTQGGSILYVLLGLGALLFVVFVAYALTRGQQAIARPQVHNDPNALYEQLLTALPFNGGHRKLLRQIAGTLQLSNPTIMLLSPAMLDQTFRRYQSAEGSKTVDVSVIHEIADVLFPPTPPPAS